MEKYTKRIMYNQIECPTCGNTTSAKSIQEAQKCQWCRRLFKITITGRGKKNTWSAEAVDFPSDMRRPRIPGMNAYMHRDIFGY